VVVGDVVVVVVVADAVVVVGDVVVSVVDVTTVVSVEAVVVTWPDCVCWSSFDVVVAVAVVVDAAVVVVVVVTDAVAVVGDVVVSVVDVTTVVSVEAVVVTRPDCVCWSSFDVDIMEVDPTAGTVVDLPSELGWILKSSSLVFPKVTEITAVVVASSSIGVSVVVSPAQ